MGQSATLYRILIDNFENSEKDKKQMISLTKDFVTFEKSFLGLDFILKKGEDERTKEIINSLFNPEVEEVDWNSIDFDSLSNKEENELLNGDDAVCILSTEKVKEINEILRRLNKEDIASRYDSKELNEHDIYPRVWHNDNSPDKAFNLKNILDDFEQLRNIFKQAEKEGDYILQFIG